MTYQGRHQAEEEFDRAKWSQFLYGLWVMRVDYTHDVAVGLAELLNADYSLIRRWLAENQDVTVTDIQYVADVCGIDARLLMEKVTWKELQEGSIRTDQARKGGE